MLSVEIDGQPQLEVTKGEEATENRLTAIANVSSVMVVGTRFRTKEGNGVGSSYADLQKTYKLDCSSGEDDFSDYVMCSPKSWLYLQFMFASEKSDKPKATAKAEKVRWLRPAPSITTKGNKTTVDVTFSELLMLTGLHDNNQATGLEAELKGGKFVGVKFTGNHSFYEELGLQTGDVIYKVGGGMVSELGDVHNTLGFSKIYPTTIYVKRNGINHEIEITIEGQSSKDLTYD